MQGVNFGYGSCTIFWVASTVCRVRVAFGNACNFNNCWSLGVLFCLGAYLEGGGTVAFGICVIGSAL